MALTVNHPMLRERTFEIYYADVSTAGSSFLYVPFRGRITAIGSVLHVAISVADSAITTAINSTAITGGAWTVTQSGSAAGDVDVATPTAANRVVEGDVIKFTTDGGSTTTAPITFFVTIRAE